MNKPKVVVSPSLDWLQGKGKREPYPTPPARFWVRNVGIQNPVALNALIKLENEINRCNTAAVREAAVKKLEELSKLFLQLDNEPQANPPGKVVHRGPNGEVRAVQG